MLDNKNGMPFIGVCLPLFFGNAGAGANLLIMKSMWWGSDGVDASEWYGRYISF